MAKRMWEFFGTMQQQLWGGAVAALVIAIASGFGEHRRRGRRDMDHVGKPHVSREHRRAVHLGRQIEARQRLAAQAAIDSALRREIAHTAR